MNDFLSVMADYLDNKVIQVTLARYAKQSLFRWPVPPDLCALAEHVHNRQAITPGLRGRVANALKRMPQENIEDLLSSDKQIFEGKEGRFRFAINAIFVEIGWNVRFEPLNRFLMKQLSLPQTRHTFLNFNYDLFLEYAIRSVTRDHFHPTWDPLSGYGFEAIEAREDKASLPAIRQKSDIQILKPHGSLNWMVPFIGAHEFQNCCAPTIYLENGELAYNSDYDLDGGWEGIFIIAPTPQKDCSFNFIRQTLELEQQALSEADDIYIIGWSAPRSDRDQIDLMRRSVRSPTQVTAVNHGADVDHFQRVAELFAVDDDLRNLRVFNAGFADFSEEG